MNYITIEARTYEEAVKKAHQQYGDRLRIHSRRDKQARGFLGLGVKRSCEIICFLADDGSEPAKPAKESRETEEKKELLRFEQEAKTPDPRKPAPAPVEREIPTVPIEPLVEHAVRILENNDFSQQYIQWMKADVVKQLEKALPAVPGQKDVETTLADRIIGSVDIDYKDQGNLPQALVFIGPEGSGKTTTLAKVAAMLTDKNIAIISLSKNQAAQDQLDRLAGALNSPARLCTNEEELRLATDEFGSCDHVLIDTSVSEQELSSMFSAVGKSRFTFVLTVPATMKNSDLAAVAARFKVCPAKAVVVTMTDQTGTIGNVISFCRDNSLPMLFVTDGRRIPRDIKRASASFIAENLKGLSIDVSTLFQG